MESPTNRHTSKENLVKETGIFNKSINIYFSQVQMVIVKYHQLNNQAYV
jgi:hypothetical protein